MRDPFTVLGVSTEASDDVIRRRYLELVRTHTPDRDPQRFAEVREAYEKLRDPMGRLEYRLFQAGADDSIEAVLADARATAPRRRASVEELLALGRKHV